MKITRNRGTAAALAFAAAAVFLPTVARAQYQVDTSGRYSEANSRLGSGGYNNGGNLSSRSLYSNLQNLNTNIATGNTTGLSYFHGNVGTFNPNVFQGNTGTANSDRLNQIAAPQNLSQRSTGQPLYTSYYNTASYNTNRPTNYASTPGGIGLQPIVPGTSPTPNTDLRIGVLPTGSDELDPAPGYGQAQDTTLSGGQVNTAARGVYVTASPLYGLRQGDGTNPSDDFFSARTGDTGDGDPSRQGANAGAAYGTNAQRLRVEAMRAELNRNVLPNDPNGPTNRTDQPVLPGVYPGNGIPTAVQPTAGQPVTGQPTSGQPTLGQPGSGQPSGVVPPTGGLRDQTVPNNGLAPLAVAAGNVTSSNLTPGTVSPTALGGEGFRYTLVVPPAQQSKQLDTLIKRFNRTDGPNAKVSDQEALARFNEEVRAQHAAAGANFVPAVPIKPGTPPVDAPMGAGGGAIKGLVARPTNPPAAVPTVVADPLVITSLADGIQAPGLARLFKQAEDQMRAGKYVAAVDSYVEAGQVAPNNPFVPLGRAFAELGASYYGRADADLTRAILSEPALLVGKYDLRTFLGGERLTFVQKDLSDIAASDKGARPLLLLAYISHNGGDDKSAAAQLDAAAGRGGNADLIAQMRKVWELKAGDATNK